MWPPATAAEETVLRIESRPGVSEVMVLTPARVANELANEIGSESVAGQGGVKNVAIVLEGGSGQIRIGKTSDGPDAGKFGKGHRRFCKHAGVENETRRQSELC